MAKKKAASEAKVNPEVFERRRLLGRKLGMTQIYLDDGTSIPVTVVQAGPCTVVQVKTVEKDGYDAVQVGFAPGAKKPKKPVRGHFEKAGVEPLKHVREFKLTTAEHGLQPGVNITVDIFEGVQKVDVSAVSKGKGFAGTIKRWHFKRGPAGHGSMNIRQPGSIGASADPARVLKGVHMAGQLGARKATCRNLKLVGIEPEENLLLIRGAVPGANGAVLEVAASFTKGKKTKS